jgi:23S rRNA pseudouridine2605 synthase
MTLHKKTNTKKEGRVAKEDLKQVKSEWRLNQYIAHAGICSRRKADELILNGEISVNGTKTIMMGQKIGPNDQVSYQGKLIQTQKKVYILINKPKDYITTTDDPSERRTVMDLIKNATHERVYPVGRLDRNTTGLLLFTNDGDLASKLAHPSFNIQKLYHVSLNKTLKPGDLLKISEGIELEDGFIQVDAISYVEGASHREVGVQIHSGKNRIVRRIFESLGYEIEKLDRSMYAGLTKKDLSKGKWRNLTTKELVELNQTIKEANNPKKLGS